MTCIFCVRQPKSTTEVQEVLTECSFPKSPAFQSNWISSTQQKFLDERIHYWFFPNQSYTICRKHFKHYFHGRVRIPPPTIAPKPPAPEEPKSNIALTIKPTLRQLPPVLIAQLNGQHTKRPSILKPTIVKQVSLKNPTADPLPCIVVTPLRKEPNASAQDGIRVVESTNVRVNPLRELATVALNQSGSVPKSSTSRNDLVQLVYPKMKGTTSVDKLQKSVALDQSTNTPCGSQSANNVTKTNRNIDQRLKIHSFLQKFDPPKTWQPSLKLVPSTYNPCGSQSANSTSVTKIIGKIDNHPHITSPSVLQKVDTASVTTTTTTGQQTVTLDEPTIPCGSQSANSSSVTKIYGKIDYPLIKSSFVLHKVDPASATRTRRPSVELVPSTSIPLGSQSPGSNSVKVTILKSTDNNQTTKGPSDPQIVGTASANTIKRKSGELDQTSNSPAKVAKTTFAGPDVIDISDTTSKTDEANNSTMEVCTADDIVLRSTFELPGLNEVDDSLYLGVEDILTTNVPANSADAANQTEYTNVLMYHPTHRTFEPLAPPPPVVLPELEDGQLLPKTKFTLLAENDRSVLCSFPEFEESLAFKTDTPQERMSLALRHESLQNKIAKINSWKVKTGLDEVESKAHEILEKEAVAVKDALVNFALAEIKEEAAFCASKNTKITSVQLLQMAHDTRNMKSRAVMSMLRQMVRQTKIESIATLNQVKSENAALAKNLKECQLKIKQLEESKSNNRKKEKPAKKKSFSTAEQN